MLENGMQPQQPQQRSVVCVQSVYVVWGGGWGGGGGGGGGGGNGCGLTATQCKLGCVFKHEVRPQLPS